MKSLRPWPYPRMIAHRGAGKLAPENTLAAMRLGHSFGYNMFEFDVKLTQDHIPVLLHDTNLDRTTNAAGRAGDYRLSELAQLDAGSWHSLRYAGEPIPTLQNIANYLVNNGLTCNVEIKPSPGDETITGTIVAQLTQQYWQAASSKPVLSSFSFDSLEAARAACPALPRGFLTNELPDNWLQLLTDLDCTSLHLSQRCVTQELVTDVKKAGFRVAVWTVNTAAATQELLQWGVDSVITDCVDTIAAS